MGKYYEELTVGEKFDTHGRTLTEGDLSTFNAVAWNTEPLHNDREWVKKNTEFRDRIFPGLCTLVVTGGLWLQTGVLTGTGRALLGMGDIKFVAPVYPGDTLHCTGEVVDRRESRSRPGVGIVTFKFTAQNQDDKVVAEYTRTVLVAKKGK